MLAIETPVLLGNGFDIVMVIVRGGTCYAIWPLSIYQAKTVTGNTATLIMSTQVAFMLIAQYTVLSCPTWKQELDGNCWSCVSFTWFFNDFYFRDFGCRKITLLQIHSHLRGKYLWNFILFTNFESDCILVINSKINKPIPKLPILYQWRV